MIKLFNEKTIDELIQMVTTNLKKAVYNLPEYQILDDNFNGIISQIREKHKLHPPIFDMTARTNKVIIENRSGSFFPLDFDVDRNKSYPCAVVTYTIPFKGDAALLSIKPKKSAGFNCKAEVTIQSLTFKIPTLYSNENLSEDVQETVKKEAKLICENLERLNSSLQSEVEKFEKTIDDVILDFLKKRKEEIDKRKKREDDLNNL